MAVPILFLLILIEILQRNYTESLDQKHLAIFGIFPKNTFIKDSGSIQILVFNDLFVVLYLL